METLKQIIQGIKKHHHLQNQDDIGSLANSRALNDEDIQILMYASKPKKENCNCHEETDDSQLGELQFDQNVFKKSSIYEMFG